MALEKNDAAFLNALSENLGVDYDYYQNHIEGYQRFAFDLLREKYLSKFECITPETCLTSRIKFLTSNERCRDYSPLPFKWTLPDLYDQFSWEISRPDLFIDFDEVMADFGPGASRGFKTEWFGDKLANFSATSYEVFKHFRHLCSVSFPRLMQHVISASKQGKVTIQTSSKACFVPKNIKSARLICVEPSCNMFLQKGFGRKIESWLYHYHSIDIEKQQFFNRDLARYGSVSGKFATIDLSSASDSISRTLVSHFLNPSFKESLELIRCSKVSFDGEEVDLHMISSQGNATTFPLQTLIFSCLVRAAYKVLGIPLKQDECNRYSSLNYSVFGDDIIVRTEAFDLVTKGLKLLGFITNDEKTFNEGPFRESCGGDYYLGRNCRPVFLYGTRKQDLYSFINRLFIWQSRTGIFLYFTNQFLLDSVKYIPIPLHHDISCGIRVPMMCLVDLKYNRRYHAISYEALKVKPKTVKFWRYSEDIQYSAFLKGVIENGRVYGLNHNPYSSKSRYFTSCWDYIDGGDSLMDCLSKEQLLDDLVYILS